MLKTLLKQIKQYRKASVLAAVFTVLEVILEVIIPMLMAAVIDNGIESGNINNVYFYGLCMIMTAVLGLACGVLAGRYAAIAFLKSMILMLNKVEQIYPVDKNNDCVLQEPF